MTKKNFDADGFYRALSRGVEARGVTWKQVSDATGVSSSTLSRMADGRRPDAASLAVLSAWAGLNPAEYVRDVEVEQVDDAEAMRLWREAGLPEYFLGNRGTNAKLVRFVELAQEAAVCHGIHYPECWDAAAYPTVGAALAEMVAAFRCSCDECPRGVLADGKENQHG